MLLKCWLFNLPASVSHQASHVSHSDSSRVGSHLLYASPWDFLRTGGHRAPITICVPQKLSQFGDSSALA